MDNTTLLHTSTLSPRLACSPSIQSSGQGLLYLQYKPNCLHTRACKRYAHATVQEEVREGRKHLPMDIYNHSTLTLTLSA